MLQPPPGGLWPVQLALPQGVGRVAAPGLQAKNAALRAAGATVPDSYEGFESSIK